MLYSSKRVVPLFGIATILASVAPAQAQISPGGGGGLGGPTQPSKEEEKKEGVAEAAPKAALGPLLAPALPPPKGRRKQWKLLEIDGYLRLRTDWFKNFHQGFIDDPTIGGAPFPRALNCTAQVQGAGCDDTLASANMRLRLEPTFNLNEGTSIHVQADVLDNLVLGSTPINEIYNGSYDSSDPSKAPPLGAFGNNGQNGQGAPVAGVNSDRDSIVIKRAWAEVAFSLGVLSFGRMPNHWGMGIWHNGGGHDPISGGYNHDADYGDTVDRVSFAATIPGTNLRAMVASDWNLTRLASNQTVLGRGREGHPWDLDDNDDMNSWVFVVSRMDTPQEFKDRVDRGDLALNYGAYFEYTTQNADLDLTGFKAGDAFDSGQFYRARGLKTYSPSVWGKLGIGKVTAEAELVAHLGSIARLDEYDFVSPASIRKYAGAGRVTYKGMEGKLRLGIEGGFASGDQHDNIVPGEIHVSRANVLGTPADTKLTQFFFNRDYQVDYILWRHLIGAVTNAAYAKPFLSYDISPSFGFKVSNVTSFALKSVATPGNSSAYGTEFDAEVGYRSGGLFVGLSYGVLFPFSALNHPATDPISGTSFGFGTDAFGNSNAKDATTSHAIQSRIVLSF